MDQHTFIQMYGIPCYMDTPENPYKTRILLVLHQMYGDHSIRPEYHIILFLA